MPDPDNRKVVDPTANVLSLVAAAIQRQDDLRNKESQCAHEIAEVRLSAQRDLAAAESKRIDSQMLAESRRIDALLAAAANAVTLASTRAELTATALAERVDTSAKTLAQSVVNSADALRTQVASAATATDARITRLEQAQYQTVGGKVQQAESGLRSQWQIGIVIGIVVAVVEIAIRLSGH